MNYAFVSLSRKSVLTILTAFICCFSFNSHAADEKVIKILWAQWPPADALNDLGKLYKKQAGVDVRVVQKSWDGAFGDTTFSEFRNKSDTYDVIIGDSQWMGLGVQGGHYVELTDWISKNVDTAEIIPASLKWYCEYPKGSKKYYAVPCEADAMAWAYRKDLFEDPKHQGSFKSYLKDKGVESFELAPPKTWEQLRWIAMYFKEKVPGMIGLAIPTSRKYDTATMGFQQVMWAFGGEYGDYETYQVKIQSPETVNALKFYQQLLRATSEGGKNIGYPEIGAEYVAGRAAMVCNFFAFFPSIASEEQNPDYYDKTGYFNMPSHTDAKGVTRRFATLGGQGMSINAHISPGRQQQAKDFLKWFSTADTQKLWAEKGGFTSNMKILQSEGFKKAAPYNPLFEEAFNMMNDFWAVPQFDDMMKVCQTEFCGVIQDGAQPEAAVARIQKAHEEILTKGGLRK